MAERRVRYSALGGLSPGELDLLRLLRRRGPVRLRKLQTEPVFRGWDLESLKSAVLGLVGLGLVTSDGDTIQMKHPVVVAAERVASRFRRSRG